MAADINDYVSQPAYFLAQRGFPVSEAIRVTLRCLSAWATAYHASPYELPQLVREGSMPKDATACEALIDDLLAWGITASQADEARGGRIGAGVILWRGSTVLFDGHDGAPMHMFLSEQEFARLQDCWARNGMPRDLFCPATEAQAHFGATGHVRPPVGANQGPQAGIAHRAESDTGTPAAVEAPGSRRGDDRTGEEFVQACSLFLDAASRRLAQLRENSPLGAPAIAESLERAIRDVWSLRMREMMVLRAGHR